jgi:hypothetical protein
MVNWSGIFYVDKKITKFALRTIWGGVAKAALPGERAAVSGLLPYRSQKITLKSFSILPLSKLSLVIFTIFPPLKTNTLSIWG